MLEQIWDQLGELSGVLMKAGRCRSASSSAHTASVELRALPASSPPCCLRSPHLLLQPSVGFRLLSSFTCCCCIRRCCILLLFIQHRDVWWISRHRSVTIPPVPGGMWGCPIIGSQLPQVFTQEVAGSSLICSFCFLRDNGSDTHSEGTV